MFSRSWAHHDGFLELLAAPAYDREFGANLEFGLTVQEKNGESGKDAFGDPTP